MKYSFDEKIDRRGTAAVNTDAFREHIFHAGRGKQFPYADKDFVRMWLPEMEFAAPQEICDALNERAEKRIFGFTSADDSEYARALSAWCRERYGWECALNELCIAPGIIPAVDALTALLCPEKSDKVLTVSPCSAYFRSAAEKNGRTLIYSRLKEERGHYTVDFDDLAVKAAEADVKLLLWSSPHDPTGRVWTTEELSKVGEIAEKNGLWLVSDESCCDILRGGQKHISFKKLMPGFSRLVVCMSACKPFSITGLMMANVFIGDAALKKRFSERVNALSLVNPLTMAAHRAAYESGAEWLDEVNAYIDGNFEFAKRFLDFELPDIEMYIPEGGFGLWLNAGKVLPDLVADYSSFFAYRAGVLLVGGDSFFADNAVGWLRINVAVPRSVLKTGLERMLHAIREYTDGDVND